MSDASLESGTNDSVDIFAYSATREISISGSDIIAGYLIASCNQALVSEAFYYSGDFGYCDPSSNLR